MVVKKSEYDAAAMKLFGIIAEEGKITVQEAAIKLKLHAEITMDILETLLDCGLLTERAVKDKLLYRTRKDLDFLILYVGKKRFSSSVFNAEKREKAKLNYHLSGMHTFDEEISLFIRESSLFFTRRKLTKFAGVCLILPDEAVSISSLALYSAEGKKFLRLLLNKFFPSSNTLIDGRAAFASASLASASGRALSFIIDERGSSVSYACADGLIRKSSDRITSLSGRKPHLCIKEDDSIENNAYAAVDCSANLISLLSPHKVLFDIPALYGSDGKNAIRRIMENQYGFKSSEIPEIIVGSTDSYCVSGAVKISSRSYARELIKNRCIFERKRL